jgi:PAS domain S-box-containing protein
VGHSVAPAKRCEMTLSGGFLGDDRDRQARVEATLRSREPSYRLIVDTIPALIATMTAEGAVEHTNRQVHEYFGKTREELKQWRTSDAVHPDDLPRVLVAWKHSFTTGLPYDIEHRMRRADGVYRWFQVRGVPLRDHEGRIVRWYVVMSDIEEARIEQEIRMEKARMEQEMRIAAEIQQALLPHEVRVGRSFRVAAQSLPCRSIGGDFYDYLDQSDGSFGFALGDVAGKGPAAALLSAMMQGIFAAHAAGSDPPARTIGRVNLALYRRGIESRFITLMYGALHPDGRLIYCNAGHNPPFVLGRDTLRRLECGGPVLGPFEGATFEEETVNLSPGDCVLVFSDGISEAATASGDEYGDDRILSCVQHNLSLEPQQLLQALFADVREFTQGTPQNDDITAMVLRYTG